MYSDLLRTGERGIGLYRWNPLRLELSWDETAAAIFEGDPAMSGFDIWSTRVHPDDHDRVLRTFSQPEDAEEVYRLVMDDRGTRHVLSRVTGRSVDPRTGEPVFTGVMMDVTSAYQPSVMLSSMLDLISDGFLMLDSDYRITYLNRRAEAILGSVGVPLLGSILWDSFPDASELFRVSYAKAMNEGIAAAFEAYYPAPLDMWLEVRAWPSNDGILVYFQNITERRARQDERERLLESERRAREEADEALVVAQRARIQLAYQASHDPLTRLINRSEFERLLRERLAKQRPGGAALTILFLDLDRFKLINDSLGHAVGDALLMQVAARIARIVGQDGAAARLGGDEFVVLLDGASEDAVIGLCDRLLRELREPVDLPQYTLSTTVSIGLASADGPMEATTLLRNADIALYRAKDAGRDRFAWFDSEAHRTLADRMSLERDLRAALDDGVIDVHYQPLFSLRDGNLSGVEALARWQRTPRSRVGPGVFIPLAEDAGLISRLGRHVASTAIAQAKQWLDIPDFRVWINVSGRQFSTSRVAEEIVRDFSESGVPPERLGVEVTESVLADEAVAVAALRALASRGVAVAIDDFGTGYSSIARLSTLPISVLKIDRSFIADAETARGRASLTVIVDLARVNGMSTVAEGIETPRQLEIVREVGVTHASGYLLGRPAPAADLVRRLPGF
ncbi:putative bifunctional diguanylate cyclase/phosphodiesterase [Planctomonas deserti]|uniref:putative bifunctional diguanylate cyclase/phosphodiesterase n=1 Tax=Planctomonas deserti TaxID=2144185 RepID=UPI000D3AD68C|nr:EAL domain-containing protein [Planctomonas deserti]